MFALTPGNAFWPYFAGAMILLIGLFAASKEASLARGKEKLFILGRVFFAVPMAVFAAQHFTTTKFVSQLIPKWIPARVFWTYFVGTALLAAALSIVIKKQARLAATLLGTMLILFELVLHIPHIISHPRDLLMWAVAFRDLAFSGGALAFAATQTEKWRAKGHSALTPLARIFISVPTIFFGVVHFLHSEFLLAVDIDQSTPPWIPAHSLWAYLAGAVFIVLGIVLVLNLKTRLAATYLGLAVLVLLAFVYLPMVIAKPADIDNSLNYFVSTLAFSGVAFLLAAAIPAGNPPEIRHP